MNNIYLENRGSTEGSQHDKFYRIVDDGSVTLSWGAIGTNGRSKVECTSDDATVRQAAVNAAYKGKLKRGYVAITIDERALESRPDASGRAFGVEVEVHTGVSIEDVVAGMRQRGLEVNVATDRYFKSNGQKWDVKRDGSCGYEFASPICRGKAGIFDVKVAVDKIREVCPSPTNSSCGLHVTIDVSDFSKKDIRKFYIAYLKAQEHFYAECNASRQNNHYCKRNGGSNVAGTINDLLGGSVLALEMSDRYQGLNLSRFHERHVIEFRMMESTASPRKIGAWIEMCVGFVDGVKAADTTFTTSAIFSKETFEKICRGEQF